MMPFQQDWIFRVKKLRLLGRDYSMGTGSKVVKIVQMMLGVVEGRQALLEVVREASLGGWYSSHLRQYLQGLVVPVIEPILLH